MVAVELDGHTVPWEVFKQRRHHWFSPRILPVGTVLACDFHAPFITSGTHLNGTGFFKLEVTIDARRRHTLTIRAPDHVATIKLM